MSHSHTAASISARAVALANESGGDGVQVGQSFAVQSTTSVPFLKQVFSFPALLGAVLVAAVATIVRAFSLDPDVWWHIKSGEAILATHRWPTVDSYSFTVAGQHWLAYEWLGDVLLAAIHRIGGLRGMELLIVFLGSAIMLGLYRLATVRSGNSKAGFVASGALLILAAVSFNMRPQMLGYLFLILTLNILEHFRLGKRGLVWLLPILMLVWINTHGSWILGLGTIGIYLASGLVEFQWGDIEARRWNSSDRLRLASVFILSSLSVVVTPYGTGLVKVPFQVASSLPLSMAAIEEWQPMPFSEPFGKAFLCLLLGFVLLQFAFRFQWRLEEIGLFLFGTIMACLHDRFLLIFVPFFAPLLATVLARWLPRYERPRDKYALNAFLMFFLLAIVIEYFPSQTNLEQNVAGKFPVEAVEYLNHHSVPGPMYNAYFFGGYLVWSRGPEHKVFLDGRSELYEHAGLLADFLEINFIRPDALAILKKYGIQSCLVERDAVLVTFLSALPDWQRVYEDQTSVLFVRRTDAQLTGGNELGAASNQAEEEHP